MRRLILSLAILLAFLPAACKRQRRHRQDPVALGSSQLSSHLAVADPRAAVQLVHGFYDPEGNSWRWTARQFSAAGTMSGPVSWFRNTK